MAGTALWGLLGSGVGAGASGVVSVAGNQLDGDTEMEPSDKLGAVVSALAGMGLGSLGGFYGHPDTRKQGLITVVDGRAGPQAPVAPAPGGPPPGPVAPAAPAAGPEAGPVAVAPVDEEVDEAEQEIRRMVGVITSGESDEVVGAYLEEKARTVPQELVTEAVARVAGRRR